MSGQAGEKGRKKKKGKEETKEEKVLVRLRCSDLHCAPLRPLRAIALTNAGSTIRRVDTCSDAIHFTAGSTGIAASICTPANNQRLLLDAMARNGRNGAQWNSWQAAPLRIVTPL